MNPEDRAKTGCMGILLPVAVAAYGVYRITHPRKLSHLFHTPLDPPTIWIGISALGIALFVHGLGFGPYQRIPGLRYVIALTGVGVFFLGLFWEQIHE
jgi:hypothetical protein